MRYANPTIFDALNAGETHVSKPIPAELMQVATCLASVSGEASSKLILEASNDGNVWMEMEESAHIEGPGNLDVGGQIAYRWIRFRYEGTPGPGTPEVLPANEIQLWTGAEGVGGGSLRVSADGDVWSDPIEIDENTQDNIAAALEDIFGAGNISVTFPDGPPSFEFIGALAETPMPLIQIDASELIGEPPENAQTTINVVDATGGTLDVSENGSTAYGIAYDASAQDVENALNGSIGDGTCFSCSGGPLNTAPVIVELVGPWAGAEGNNHNLNLAGHDLEGEGAYAECYRSREGSDAGQPSGEVVRFQEGTPGSPAQPADPGVVNATAFLQGSR